jgi:hypothetical protein
VVALITLNPLKGADVPYALVIVNVYELSAASDAMLRVTGVVLPPKTLALPLPTVPDTSFPLKLMALAPSKLLPMTVVVTVAPGVPAPIRIPVIVGGPGCRTVKLLSPDVPVPAPVVTLTVRDPGVASDAIVTTMGSDVAVPPGRIIAVTPVPANVTE